LADMVNDGVTHVVMEVTSHAIDLCRVDHCGFTAGVFTNLTQDHLDYHKNMNAYWACKKKFFTDILDSGTVERRVAAIINQNNEKGRELLNALSETARIPMVLSVGESSDNNIWPTAVAHDLTGMHGTISTPKGTFEFKSSLVGRHNLENILCATGAGVALNLSLNAIKAGLEAVAVVPGRLERIANNLERFVYVDYAHTPDALKNVLSALKKLSAGRMICVFGCGGNRDRAKRPQMGEISGNFCDLTIITSDNPRAEPPLDIIAQVLEGLRKTGICEYTPLDLAAGFQQKGYAIEPDRKTAIQLAMTASRPGDTVIIAGKGNETYQIIGNQSLPFDDRQEARAALSRLRETADIFLGDI
ncbi:MAG: UDP-N-acetylmuramoyl-L-alanyl-D-glutamate--2,6-diaminopimelate ligase, partial [Proteobacteria bacterium]|nr:UDP-N-acetylmuramoyl-L-alanyl-D-glutamate--2,6-diaminopimelate ligase [Pseudomonadota bacterium]